MVEQRQLAERWRVKGNDAFKAGQYSEALRCYDIGLDAQRHNSALHANAAMAALKLNCYVQAIEHCDKVMHLQTVLFEKPLDSLCVKALQRRGTAYKALKQPAKSVADFKKAVEIEPENAEVSESSEEKETLEIRIDLLSFCCFFNDPFQCILRLNIDFLLSAGSQAAAASRGRAGRAPEAKADCQGDGAGGSQRPGRRPGRLHH